MQTDYKYNMGNLTYPDIQDYLKKKDIVMVPIASLEQHSYHCPLHGSDTARIIWAPRVWG